MVDYLTTIELEISQLYCLLPRSCLQNCLPTKARDEWFDHLSYTRPFIGESGQGVLPKLPLQSHRGNLDNEAGTPIHLVHGNFAPLHNGLTEDPIDAIPQGPVKSFWY